MERKGFAGSVMPGGAQGGFFNAFERMGPPWGKLSSTVGR
jgi:hypothetical protein